MKKFKFSLLSLYKYKQTVEKIQLGELRRAEQALRELLDEKQRILDDFAENERSLVRALRQRYNVGEALTLHDRYFVFLRDSLEELEPRIARAETVRDRCREKLILTMREIKTLGKLRDEQYAAYLKEIQAESEKEIGDLVSFKTISEAS